MADIQTICETFSLFDSWQDRYAYIIELGQNLPPLAPEYRTPAHKVSGCVSQVWVVPTLEDGRLVLKGESDSHLVKGLIAIVFAFYSHKTLPEVISTPIHPTLATLHLSEGLTPQRSNGLNALIATIQAYAIKNHTIPHS